MKRICLKIKPISCEHIEAFLTNTFIDIQYVVYIFTELSKRVLWVRTGAQFVVSGLGAIIFLFSKVILVKQVVQVITYYCSRPQLSW